MRFWTLFSMIALAFGLVCAAVPHTVTAQALVDGFDFPLKTRGGSPQPSVAYNVRNPYLDNEESRCYGKALSELQHAGEDYKGEAEAPVSAIANGRVVWSGSTAEFYGTVIIEHILPEGVANPWGGNLIYSLYGHLQPESVVARETEVQRGQVIGRLRSEDNPHFHLEVRRYASMEDAPSSVNDHPFCQ